MQRLNYVILYSKIEPDWRVLAMQHLEYTIVCKAMRTKIPHYKSDDLAQELRITLWNNLNSYNPTKSKLTTWANTVLNNRLRDIHKKECGTQKRKDWLMEEFYDQNLV